MNVLDERNAFAALRSWMLTKGLSLRGVFWLTGLAAFVLSPVLDNLTTALVMGAVVLAVGRGERRFLVPACINIVVAANAGGAFSPFGDITTLMVWQKGAVKFTEFFDLFLPALVNWLVPAACMHFAVPTGVPQAEGARVALKRGSLVIVGLFAMTIAATVLLHQWLHLPSFLGMMSGLGLLLLYGYFIRRRESSFDVFEAFQRLEWDTLLFFYGVVLCVGGLGALGYLALLSQHSYFALGPGGDQCRGRHRLRHHRQHPHHVRGAVDGSADEPWPLAAGHIDRGRGWLVALDRLGRRRGADGAGAWGLYLHGAPEVDLGDRARLCRFHLAALPHQRFALLATRFASSPSPTTCASNPASARRFITSFGRLRPRLTLFGVPV